MSKRPDSNALHFLLWFRFSEKTNWSKVNSSEVTPKQMASLRNQHETKRGAKWFWKKDPKAHQRHVTRVQCAVSDTDGRTRGHICPCHHWQSKGWQRNCYRWKDLGTGMCGRCSARCGWQEPMTNIAEVSPLTACCQTALLAGNSRRRGTESRTCAKVVVPMAGSAHLSLGKHNCVQKSMFFKVITQVFLSEVLTEVLSMLRTGLPNGKCPHGGFWLINLFSLTCS